MDLKKKNTSLDDVKEKLKKYYKLYVSQSCKILFIFHKYQNRQS